MNHPRQLYDDPRLTAYALGELPAEERPEIEAMLRTDPTLRATVAEIREAAAAWESAFAGEAAEPVTSTDSAPLNGHPRTSTAQPPALPPGNPTPRTTRRLSRPRGRLVAFPQFYYIASGLAVACFAVLVALYRDTFDAKERLRSERLRIALEPRTVRDLGLANTVQLPVAPSVGETTAPGTRETDKTPIHAASSSHSRENPFRGVRQNPLSTFPVDVDTVSYTQLRRFIEERQLPPADAIRIEELLNYFDYHYPAPPPSASAGPGTPVAASLEVTEAPWAPDHRLVRIGIKGREVATADRPAANLVFLVAVFGSTNTPNRLPLVKESVRMLLGELRSDDRIALVTYSGISGLALPSTPVANTQEILAALDALTPGETTNSLNGLHLAYDIAKANFTAGGVNRVILCTDGDFKVGPAGTGELLRLVDEKAKANLTLSVLRFGLEHRDDSTLDRLAVRGHGDYSQINSRREAQKHLIDEITSTLATIAKDVRIQVEFNPAKVASYRLIGYENRELTSDILAEDAAGPGEMGSGHEVTALYEIVPAGTESEGRPAPAVGEAGTGLRYQAKPVTPRVPAAVAGELLTVRLHYKDPSGNVSRTLEFPLVDRGGKFAAASTDFRFAAAVAEFGMILRQSPHRGRTSLGDVLAWAETATGGPDDDPGGYRAEFLDLVRKTQTLME